MKRDMEYVRELLLKLEAAPTTTRYSTELLPGGVTTDDDRAKLTYHLQMLIEETGLVRAIAAHTNNSGKNWINLQLTWQGHEFVETVRDAEVWSRTKEGAKKVGNSGLEFILDLAKAYAKHVAKERLGIEL